MPYVHLSNGETETLTDEEMTEAFGDNPRVAYEKDGIEYLVIGVYPDAVELDTGKSKKPVMPSSSHSERK